MVFAGGLELIYSRVLLDVLAWLGFVYSIWTHPSLSNTLTMAVTVCVIWATSGSTSRWPITFPMAPILVLQVLRRQGSKLGNSRLICYTSLLLVLLSMGVSVLFPPLQLPPVQSGGPYNVGAVSMFLPIIMEQDNQDNAGNDNATCDLFNHTHVQVRLLYPTIHNNGDAATTKKMPYLDPALALEFLQESMKAAAPPPLKPYDWLMHHWLLTELPIQRHAPLLPPASQAKFPLVVYSHGLMGNADLYSYQAMSLVTQGMVVLMVNHLDGSAPIAEHHDGSRITFDYDIIQLWVDGKKKEYTLERQARTEWRARELIGATEALLQMSSSGNENNNAPRDMPSHLQEAIQGRIDRDKIFFMGHSFGGATALTAAYRRPDLVEQRGGVIAHEPCVDWMPYPARRSLMAQERLTGLEAAHNYTGGEVGWEFETTAAAEENDDDDDAETTASDAETATATASLHKLNLLFLFSDQWRKLNWGESHILEEMHQKGRLGSPQDGGVVHYGVIDQAHHNEFSDMCMLTPLWLARGTGVTGPRNPLETAHEIEQRTWKFISSVLSSSTSSSS